MGAVALARSVVQICRFAHFTQLGGSKLAQQLMEHIAPAGRTLHERFVEERRDICPLNRDGEPLESLPKDDCWPIGLVEARLAALQDRVDGGQGRRVSLRSLFEGDQAEGTTP